MESYECAVAAIASEELADNRQEVVEDAIDSKCSSDSFETTEDVKKVCVDPDGSKEKTMRISTMLFDK